MARTLVHTEPADVTLQQALEALSDPVQIGRAHV